MKKRVSMASWSGYQLQLLILAYDKLATKQLTNLIFNIHKQF